MGFGDKLKELRDQAQSAVAENKDKIQGAVATVGEVANTKTKGKYADKIAKVGEKVSSSVEKMGVDAQEPGVNAETTVAEVPEAPEELIHPETAQPVQQAKSAGPPPDFDE
jgi:gas vesicle protein